MKSVVSKTLSEAEFGTKIHIHYHFVPRSLQIILLVVPQNNLVLLSKQNAHIKRKVYRRKKKVLKLCANHQT